MASPLDYLNDPRVRQFLDGLAGAEGVKHSYYTIFGNERLGSLAQHPNVRKRFKQTDGTWDETTAAGRYQFLKTTWDEQARRYGLKDFSPRSQDIAAIGLIMQNGALKDILSGNTRGAISKLGGIWASLPTSRYAQPRKSWEQTDRLFGSNGSPKQNYQDQYVDLNALRKKQHPQQQYVDLNALRKQSQQQQPQYVDLNALRQKSQPQYVDLNALRGQQQGMTGDASQQEYAPQDMFAQD